MSSIVTSSTGLRRIEIFVDGQRRRIRLGRMPAKAVNALRVRLDDLATAKSLHRRDAEAEKWCDSLDVKLRGKLMDAGLLSRRDEETLVGLVKRFFASRSHVKPATVAADKQATDSLVKFFGGSKLIRSITAIDAQAWRESLEKENLAGATIAKRVIKAKSVFAKAVRPWKLLDENPLDDLRTGTQENPSRIRFIDRDSSLKVLEKCPNVQWRAIFSLARWAGLRIPSELALLRWSDVEWDARRLRIRSPKTEHHKGHEERYCPLLPQVVNALVDLRAFASPGIDLIFADRKATANLRTRMTKIVNAAGLKVWPKLFHNLRATLQTELSQIHPLYVVCRWLGNSPRVADKHYLSLPDSVYVDAAQKAAQSPDIRKVHANFDVAILTQKPGSRPQTESDQWAVQAQSIRKSLRRAFKKQIGGAKSGALARIAMDVLRAHIAKTQGREVNQ